MRSAIVLALFAALAAIGGCRREDVREMTVLMPELKEADRAKVAESLAKYQGVLKDSYVWDMAAQTLFRTSRLVFGVYLVHPLVMTVLVKVVPSSLWGFVTVRIALCMATCVASFVFAALCRRLPCLRRIV